MLDFRYDTFLELCKVKNYTKAARSLHISQPTVTQHIHWLEEKYKEKLFYYDNKVLTLTKCGEQLLYYTQKISAECCFIKQKIMSNDAPLQVSFGTTCTFGEFVLPSILSQCMAEDHMLRFSMVVEYKEILLQQLLDGEILFAYFDGDFDQNLYTGRFFSDEQLVAVCSPSSPLREHSVTLDDLLAQNLIVREEGIDCRNCLDIALSERSVSISQFANLQEICNVNAIKHLVSENNGISFLYASTVEQDIAEERLCVIDVDDFNVNQPFKFVYLRGTLHENLILSFFELHQRIFEQIKK